MWRVRPGIRQVALASLLLVALGLGVTRGAYVGLAAGMVIYMGLIVYRHGRSRQLRNMAAIILLAGVVGLVMPVLLLNPNRQGMLLAEPRRPPAPSVEAEPPPNHLGSMEYRMSMVQLGIEEFAQSPLIGRGAYSFGQRHLDPAGDPAVIAIWPLSVAYDAGIIGLAALSAFFVLLGHRLLRATRDRLLLGPAAAFAGSVAVLLVAYLATTALHFAVTWLIIGCAVGATLNRTEAGSERPGHVEATS